MNKIQGAVHYVANNRLQFEKGPSPFDPQKSAADQVGHKYKKQEQPSLEEILPKLETPAIKQRLDDLLSRYPEPQGALLEVLWLIQEALGWVPREAIRYAAGICECSPVHAFSVATFYTMYKHAPTGRFLLLFCRNICCEQKGASNIIAYTEKSLGIQTGETTPDGLFTIVQVECLGACANAPVMLVNDDYATDVQDSKLSMLPGTSLNEERVDKILNWCRERAKNLKEEPTRDALGGPILGHKGHPGAPGATAKVQSKNYAPPSPVLGVQAALIDGGVQVSWKCAPDFTHLLLEKKEGSTWKQVAEPPVRTTEIIDPSGEKGSVYRMIATSGERVAKPSLEVEAK